MPSQFFFNGQLFSTPTTQSKVNDTGFAPATLGGGNTLALVGNAVGGQPNAVLSFTSPQQAQAALISGDLLTAISKAFSPSAQTGTPSKVLAVVVGQATQATGTLNATGAVPLLTILSDQYGVPANQTKIKVETGTNSTAPAPSFKVSCALGSTLVVQDNLYRLAFSCSYSGAAASATIQVSGASVILSAPSGAAVKTIALTANLTVDQLVDQINGVSGFAAAVGLGSTGKPTLQALDYLAAAQDCKTAPYLVTATIQAALDWLNGSTNNLVSATRLPNVGGPLALAPWVFLTGAVSPAPVVQDWTNAFATLQTADCQWVVPLSADPAVQAAMDAHVQYMSTVGRRERRAFVGPALGTTLAQVEALPLALNSDRTAVCYPGYLDYDQNGNLTTFASYFTAAMIAAGFAGASPGDAMTNKAFSVRGLEAILRNPTDTDPLIQSGVLCLESTSEGYKCVRSISSWLVNNNFNRVEVSCGAAVDYMVRAVRTAVGQARGGRQGPQLLGLAISVAQSVLADLAKPLPGGPGILVGDANSPPYGTVTGSIQGDQLLLNFNASPVIPNNFIGVTVGLVAYSGTASV